MSARLAGIQESLHEGVSALPGVFSTAQWGGWAYKLPGPGGSKRKPKLLAHAGLTKQQDAVFVAFKLAPERAEEIVERYEWIEPHSFRTLAPSGWISARITTKRQAATVLKLLAESHAAHPSAPDPEPERPARGRVADPTARRIDSVMNAVKADGWQPGDDFDDG